MRGWYATMALIGLFFGLAVLAIGYYASYDLTYTQIPNISSSLYARPEVAISPWQYAIGLLFGIGTFFVFIEAIIASGQE